MQTGETRTRGPDIPVEQFLVNLPLFSDLTPEEIKRIAAGTRRIYAAKGETLFSRGERCEGFHVVLYGQVKLSFVTPSGQEKVVEIIGPGGSFGEALMFMEKAYIVMAQTLADTMLLHVAKDAVFDELAREPAFAKKMLAGLSRRLHSLISDVESYSLQSGTQRVIGYLLRQDDAQAADSGATKLTLPVSKAIVASRLNLTPEHFSRILHDLQTLGLISVDGRDVHIVDVARLRAYTG